MKEAGRHCSIRVKMMQTTVTTVPTLTNDDRPRSLTFPLNWNPAWPRCIEIAARYLDVHQELTTLAAIKAQRTF